MSKIDKAEVRRLAALAKIGLSAEETAAMAGELDRIVGFVEQLQKVETEGVSPTDHVTGLVDVTRPDEVRPSMSPDELLANAPERYENYVKVRRVL